MANGDIGAPDDPATARSTPTGLEGQARALRWLVVPIAVGLLVLTGLASSTEQADDFLAGDQLEVGSDAGGGGGELDGSSVDGPAVVIGSGTGDVGVQLGRDSPLAWPSTPSAGDLPPVILDSSAAPQAAGFRLTADGRLEPVDQAAIGADDLVVEPAGGGIDVIGEDGERVEIRLDPAALSGVEATRLGLDGTAVPIEIGSASEVDLGGGLSLEVPEVVIGQQPDVATPGDVPQDESTPSNIPWRWIVLALVAIAAVTLLVIARRRERPSEDDESYNAGPLLPKAIPIERFDEFAAALLADDDPARAIRLAFGAAERGIGPLGARLAIETPFEWYQRVTAGAPELSRPLGALCDSFAATRFAEEPPTFVDRDTAVAHLVTIGQIAKQPARDTEAGRQAMMAGARGGEAG